MLSLESYSREEILYILRLSLSLKRLRSLGSKKMELLRGSTIALIFEKPSTRTRASMSVAAYEVGAQPMVYNWSELQLGRGEPIKDVARVLSRYHDCIAARVYKHSSLEELAAYSSVPVLNMLSDKFHPLQALADYMTIWEKLGRLEGVRLAFVGDGTDNVLNSLIIAGSKLGVEITVAAPRRYWPSREVLRLAGGKVAVTEDPGEAVRNAEVVYTDVFVSMGQEAERDARIRTFVPRYRVTRGLLEAASEDYIFMHCLPARRGEEVDEEVIEDREHSAVWDQAENRLHTSKAVLVYLLLGGRLPRAGAHALRLLKDLNHFGNT